MDEEEVREDLGSGEGLVVGRGVHIEGGGRGGGEVVGEDGGVQRGGEGGEDEFGEGRVGGQLRFRGDNIISSLLPPKNEEEK